MSVYNHTQIEEKWLQHWEENRLFLQTEDQEVKDIKDKMYLLFAFAYPSGQGLHVGHVESKTALDILARYYRMNGKSVFFPVGWDAFGLPAENYAIKTSVPPVKTTKNAINTFRRQIKRLGISYDWANEIATCHPGYYKWTQWLFLQLHQAGLAYQDTGMVNWCPSCQTVLANEQVVDGLCERCEAQVIQKEMEQWFFKITDYKDELISGLDQVDWPEPTKRQQLNWIGKKEGIDIYYQVEGTAEQITCFTTRPDTNFGATFIVLAPEHEFTQKVAKEELIPSESETKNCCDQVKEYIDKAAKKTELERQQSGRKKTGVFTGFYAINNLTGYKMPIWVSDFVLGSFGTGAVVGVPGHDKRDFEFVEYVNKKLGKKAIEVIRVVVASDGDKSPITRVNQVQEDEGTMVNSDFLNDLDIHKATLKIMDYMEEKEQGKRVTAYKLRDWLISRQRYWGAPIPIVYDPEGKPHPVKEEHLPWELPTDVDFKPTGESPLRSSKEFKARTEKLYGKGWTPEYDTMDTFVDSSWYYLRYVSSRDEAVFADKSQLKKWMPVDFYMIGPEHIVLHLLYSRFLTKFLRDQGYLNFDEPFMKMRHQGMILGPDGRKMSKSKGNVINPDEIVEKFGADTLRMYEMFIGPIEADKPWDPSSVLGNYRFLNRVYKLVQTWSTVSNDLEIVVHEDLQRKLHQTIKKVSHDVPALKFNTAIAAMMELINVWEAAVKKVGNAAVMKQADVLAFIKILAPFAPFMAEELYQQVAEKPAKSIHLDTWPEYDPKIVKELYIYIPIQINGKIRGETMIEMDRVNDQDWVLREAKSEIANKIKDLQLIREIYVPGKIVSLVVK